MRKTPRTNIAAGLVGEGALSEDEWPDFARTMELEALNYREALERIVTHAECDHDGMTYQELADMARAALKVQP